jgi:hypothetical protein
VILNTMKTLILATGLSLLSFGLAVSPAAAQQRPARALPSQILPTQIVASDDVSRPSLTSDPTPNYTQAQQLLNQLRENVRTESIGARIRRQEMQDLLTSDYVGNLNYSRANAIQQFGEYALWENRYRYLNY